MLACAAVDVAVAVGHSAYIQSMPCLRLPGHHQQRERE